MEGGACSEAGEPDQSVPSMIGRQPPLSHFSFLSTVSAWRPGRLSCLKGQENKDPYADLDCIDQMGNRKTPDGWLLCPVTDKALEQHPPLTPYLSVSWRLLPLDKEIERKKPWTAGTVYNKRVLDKSC